MGSTIVDTVTHHRLTSLFTQVNLIPLLDGWMDGCSLRFMGVNPLYELFAGLQSLHAATRTTLWAE